MTTFKKWFYLLFKYYAKIKNNQSFLIKTLVKNLSLNLNKIIKKHIY